jgi:CRP-like cAMP-binding protein
MQLTEKERNKILDHPFFSGLDREETSRIIFSHGCRLCDYANGETILSPVSTEKSAGLILSGSATVTTTDTSKHALLRFLQAGDLFGVSNLFTDEPFATRIVADKHCRVFFLPREAILSLLSASPAFLSRYLEFLCNRVCFLNRKIGYLTAGSAERRLALYLSSYGSGEILLEESLSSLSDLLDVGRASLYRAFDRMTEDGFIKKEGRKITVLNSEAMLKAYQ